MEYDKRLFDNPYLRNILSALSISQSGVARSLVVYDGRIERFLEFVFIAADHIVAIVEGDESTAQFACEKVFPYGWLSPQGEFIKVSHAKHEFMVRETTGFSDCDSACDAGWVKFTVGLPYNLMKADVCSKLIRINQNLPRFRRHG